MQSGLDNFICLDGASERQTGNLICHIIYLFAFGKGNCLVKMCEDFKQVSHALNRLQLGHCTCPLVIGWEVVLPV